LDKIDEINPREECFMLYAKLVFIYLREFIVDFIEEFMLFEDFC